jgi:hypothetical protein
MAEFNPKERARQIQAILADYYDGGGDYATRITDLLADVRHFCFQHEIEAEGLWEMAEIHFQEEAL